MQAAWQAASPQTTAQLLISVNTARTHKSTKHLTHGGVAKALEQLQQNGYLRRDNSDTRSAVFHILIAREQYVADAMQSLSQSVLGVNVADLFPAILGRIKPGRRKPDGSRPDAEPSRVAENEASSVETLAKTIAASQNSGLKE